MTSNFQLALSNAKKVKNDEFYTRYEDVEKEISHYPGAFEGKSIYLNCDTPQSNFWKYFKDHFVELGLKCLIASDGNGSGWQYDKDGDHHLFGPILGRGYSSPECLELLDRSDIVVTNPPFSKLREFIPFVVESGKQFIVLGNLNCLKYVSIFPSVRDGKIWVGTYHGSGMSFDVAEGDEVSLRNCCWITNVDDDRSYDIELSASSASSLPFYDNYQAVNVDKLVDIPDHYYGVIGVPVTFLTKYRKTQSLFNVLGVSSSCEVGGKKKYARVFIQRKAVK